MMKKINFKSGSNSVSVRAIIFGALAALTVSMIGAGFFAWLIGKGMVDEKNIGIIGVAIVFASALTGSFVSTIAAKSTILLQTCVMSIIYVFLLVCINVLLFSGQFKGVIPTLLAALLGAVVVAILKSRNAGNRKKMKIRSK